MENPYNNFEFLTGISYCGREYIGIVSNADNTVFSFYDIEALPSPDHKRLFLELGETWWWESNREIPIEIFLYHDMKPFLPYLKTFVAKDVEVLFGPVTSLQNLIKKRIKKRSIQLVKKTR